jgi:hypothetical protein
MTRFIRSLLRTKVEHTPTTTILTPDTYEDFKRQCQAIPGAIGYYTISPDQKISYTVKIIG